MECVKMVGVFFFPYFHAHRCTDAGSVCRLIVLDLNL